MSSTENNDHESDWLSNEYGFEIPEEDGRESLSDYVYISEPTNTKSLVSWSAGSLSADLAEDKIDFEFELHDLDFDLTDRINLIEALRLERFALIQRKDNAMFTLTKLFQKGMVS